MSNLYIAVSINDRDKAIILPFSEELCKIFSEAKIAAKPYSWYSENKFTIDENASIVMNIITKDTLEYPVPTRNSVKDPNPLSESMVETA